MSVVVPLLFYSPDVYGAQRGGAGDVVVDRVVLVVGCEEQVVVINGDGVVGVVGVGGSGRWSARPRIGSGGVVGGVLEDGDVCIVVESDALSVGCGCVRLEGGGGCGGFVVVGSGRLLGPDLLELHGSLR